jgi:hypothetical protein
MPRRSRSAPEPTGSLPVKAPPNRQEIHMGRYMLLWLLGVPIPILLLIWAFGGLH